MNKQTGTTFLPTLCFDRQTTMARLLSQTAKLQKKGELSCEQLWLGSYFQKEILSASIPDVSIRWVDDQIGWGVFAERRFKEMEWIAEYTGILRKRKKEDEKNSYCFEYRLAPDVITNYSIDGRDHGGISRYINHNAAPNLTSALATVGGVTHVILYTNRPIQAGEQLCYDYGPDYWKKRALPS